MGNHRIVKNAALLYVRMAAIMLITLYTSRVIIQSLGIVDYGLYGVIHGVVASFAFFSSSLTNAIQRFLNNAIGKGESIIYINKIFSQAFWIVAILLLILLVLCETIGLWFVKEKLDIPSERYDACISLFHSTVIVLLLHTVQIPFTSAIMAREKFAFYAWTSIVDVIMKLFIVYILQFNHTFDSLVLYGHLLVLLTSTMCLTYIIYCIIRIKESRVTICWNNELIRSLSSFIGYNFVGSTLNLFSINGLNVICNIFIGPIANAAITIMFQVKTAIFRLAEGVFSAVKPPIIQSYAQGNVKYMNTLVDYSSKYVFILVFTFSLSLIFETHYILTLWLNEIPEGTIIITKLILIDVMFTVLIMPLTLIAIARGKIKNIEIYGRSINILSLIIILFYFNCGGKSIYTVVAFYVISTFFYFLYCVKDCLQQINRSIISYINKVLLPILKISVSSIVVGYIITKLFEEGILRFIIIMVCVGITNLLGLYFCASPNEKNIMIKYILRKNYNESK